MYLTNDKFKTCSKPEKFILRKEPKPSMWLKISALGRLRQQGCLEFRVSLGYIVKFKAGLEENLVAV